MDPILVTILKAFQTTFSAAISLGIATVKINPFQPSDIDSVEFPFIGLFYTPQTWENRGRAEEHIGIVTIESYFRWDTGKEDQYLFLVTKEAEMHQEIFEACKQGLLKSLIQNITRNTSEYLLIDDTLLSIIQEYKITFLHTFGDPFSNIY
jgi:hypothetical protein